MLTLVLTSLCLLDVNYILQFFILTTPHIDDSHTFLDDGVNAARISMKDNDNSSQYITIFC
jgi:hypothetical protein